MRNTFIDTVIAACRKRDDIFILSGDAGLGVFDDFKVEFPHRFLNMGVAEQNMIGFAAGLAMSGYKVVLYNIIPFLLYRCYEQLRNDICYQELPVVLAGIGSGVTYAPMGMTHYSVEDLGIARTLPNLKVISPIDPVEAKLAAEYALSADSPVYVRLAKRGEPRLHGDEPFDITRPKVLRQGEQTAILFHGSISTEVMAADTLLRAQGIEPRLISVPMVQPADTEALLPHLKGVQHVFCVEEHFVGSGLGSVLLQELSRCGSRAVVHSMGIKDDFIHLVSDNDGMREHFGITGRAIAEHVSRTLKGISQ